MPLFSREIKANGVKTDLHDKLTAELIDPYVEENGLGALHGYTDGVDDMIWAIEAMRKKETTLEGLQQALSDFVASQAEFSLNTARKIGDKRRRMGLIV